MGVDVTPPLYNTGMKKGYDMGNATISYCVYSCDCVATQSGSFGEPVCDDHA